MPDRAVKLIDATPRLCSTAALCSADSAERYPSRCDLPCVESIDSREYLLGKSRGIHRFHFAAQMIGNNEQPPTNCPRTDTKGITLRLSLFSGLIKADRLDSNLTNRRNQTPAAAAQSLIPVAGFDEAILRVSSTERSRDSLKFVCLTTTDNYQPTPQPHIPSNC